MENISNLEANLCSKTNEVIVAEEKRAKMEERSRKAMDLNWEHAKTSSKLEETYKILKFGNERLQEKIQELRARFRAQENSSVLEKTYAIYSMRSKTLEDAKISIKNIDDYIAEARALEITSLQNIPSRSTVSSSSKTCSEFSALEEEDEDIVHKDKETHEQTSAPKKMLQS